MPQKLNDLIAATTELAALPSTMVRLLDLLDEPDAGVGPVLEIIEKDPALTANLLKLSNSAYYGLRRRVGTVREALVQLGNRTVVTLAFAASMGEMMRGPMSGYRLRQRQLWHHALTAAVAAARLAGTATGEERDRAFTAALVHDIGKMLLDRPLRAALEQVPPHATSAELAAAERQILGYDHVEAGRALAEAWSFPLDLTEAIGEHLGPNDASSSLVRLVAAADLLAIEAGFPAGADLIAPDDLDAALAHVAGALPVAELLPDIRTDLEGMLLTLGETR